MLAHPTFRSAKLRTIPHPAKKTGEKCHYLCDQRNFPYEIRENCAILTRLLRSVQLVQR